MDFKSDTKTHKSHLELSGEFELCTSPSAKVSAAKDPDVNHKSPSFVELSVEHTRQTYHYFLTDKFSINTTSISQLNSV